MPKRNQNKRNKNNKNKKNKQKRMSKQVKIVNPPGVGLSHCAMKYALAISDPWNPEARGACVPRTPSRPSYKVTAFKRITVTIGTGNYGGLFFSPTIANDVYSIYSTTATFAGSTFTQLTSAAAAGTVLFSAMGNLPYPQTSFVVSGASKSPDVAGRIVSASVSWQYTGTVSDMGGLAYALCHPDHNNLNDTPTDIPSFAECEIIRVDNKRHWVGISGIDEEETSYSESHTTAVVAHSVASVCYPFSNRECHNATDTSVGGAPIAVWFTGKAGNTFEVEIVQHCEFVGKSTQAQTTPSHADAVGFEIVQNASSKLPLMIQNSPSEPRKSLMAKALHAVGRELAPVVRIGAENLIATGARAIAGAAMGYMTGGPAGAVYGGALGVSSGALRLTNG